MERRDFLKIGMAGAAWPLLSERFGGGAWAMAPMNAMATQGIGERVLVVIRLDGGNDGLATVLPLDRYDALAKVRGNVLIPAAQGLKLTETAALHPKLKGMHALYQAGQLAVVQAVGYPNHNQSHFRSTDIFFTASDFNQVLNSGWLGRYLDLYFPGFPEGYPSADYPDPPAIQMGSVSSTLLQGGHAPMAMTVSNPNSIYTLSPDGADTPPDTPYGHELAFVRSMAQQTQKFGESVKGALAKAATKSSLWPASGNKLADQLQAIARLIAGGVRTPVYVATLGGFDTHSGQVDGADLAGGRHGELMALLDAALAAFQDELRLQACDDRVIGVTVSEFGRRIASNASLGTDHGTSAPVFLFGKPVKGGLVGTSPAIPEAATVKDNVPMQFDFRQVYAALLRDHLGLSGAQVASVLLKDFDPLPLVGVGIRRKPGFAAAASGDMRLAGGSAYVTFDLDRPGWVKAGVYDVRGESVAREVRAYLEAGRQSLTLPLPATLPQHLFMRVEGNGLSISRRVTTVP